MDIAYSKETYLCMMKHALQEAITEIKSLINFHDDTDIAIVKEQVLGRIDEYADCLKTLDKF